MILADNCFANVGRKRVLLVSDSYNAKYNTIIVKALAHHTVIGAKTFTDFLTPYAKLATDNHCDVIVFNSEHLLRRLIDSNSVKISYQPA